MCAHDMLGMLYLGVVWHVHGRGCNLRRTTFVVLDEADRMLQMGFEVPSGIVALAFASLQPPPAVSSDVRVVVLGMSLSQKWASRITRQPVVFDDSRMQNPSVSTAARIRYVLSSRMYGRSGRQMHH